MNGNLIPQLLNIPVIGGQGFTRQGNQYFVCPRTGSDANPGNNIGRPLKTLKKALSLATANQNDVVFLVAEHSTTSASTTDYLTANLDWNKNMVHLVGIGTGGMINSRSRVATKTVLTTALFTVSASGCIFSNITWYFGYAGITTTGIGAVLITGNMNCFYNCTISGIGHDDMDVTDAYSLKISGGEENFFNHCYIGLNTIARGTAVNSEIVFASHAPRNRFEDCVISTYAEAASHIFITAAAASLDRVTVFKRCEFLNPVNSAATSMTEAFSVTSPTGGTILVHDCAMVGAALWEASAGASTEVQMVLLPKNAAQTGGIGFATA